MESDDARDLLGNLVDALIDDLGCEVSDSPAVAKLVGDACRLLGDSYLDYLSSPEFGPEPVEDKLATVHDLWMNTGADDPNALSHD